MPADAPVDRRFQAFIESIEPWQIFSQHGEDGIIKAFFKRIKRSSRHLSIEYAIAAAYLVSYAFSCGGDNLPDYLVINWYVWFFIGILLMSASLNHENNIRHYPLV